MAKAGLDPQVYSAMQNDEPKRRYIKTILGKLYVTVLNPFTGEPEGLIVKGNPKTEKNKCVINVWSDVEDVFLRRMNQRHFEQGNLIEFRGEIETVERFKAEFTDEELNTILNSPFLKLKSELGKMEVVPPVFRLLEMANEQEKSEKLISMIEARLSELQENEYGIGEDGDNDS